MCLSTYIHICINICIIYVSICQSLAKSIFYMMFYNVTFVLLTRDKLKGISISFTFLCVSLAVLFRSLYLPIILIPTNTSIFSNLYSCFTRSPSFFPSTSYYSGLPTALHPQHSLPPSLSPQIPLQFNP